VDIADLRLDDREIGLQPALLHIMAAIELGDDLAVCKLRPVARWSVESRNASPAGADALGERALRHQLQFDLPGKVPVGEGTRVG